VRSAVASVVPLLSLSQKKTAAQRDFRVETLHATSLHQAQQKCDFRYNENHFRVETLHATSLHQAQRKCDFKRNANHLRQKRCERDSSGTTVAQAMKWRSAKVMERIARREREARSGSPNKLCFAQFKLKIKN
jgi:hypothetical protein